jgi:hypothetical protein
MKDGWRMDIGSIWAERRKGEKGIGDGRTHYLPCPYFAKA